MKLNKKLIGIILIFILINIFWFYTVKVYASESPSQALTLNEEDEETMVRMVTSLAKGNDTDNKIDINTLRSFFDKYIGEGIANITDYSSTLIHVTLNTSRKFI